MAGENVTFTHNRASEHPSLSLHPDPSLRRFTMSFQKCVYRLAATTLLGLALPIIVLAQAPAAAAQKIGVVDTQNVLMSSSAGKALAADMDRQQQQARTRLEGLQEKLKALQSQISDGSQSMSAEKANELKKELENKTTEFARARDDAMRELEKLRDSGLASLEKQIMPVINQVAKEMGYTLIFRKYESGLIYADDATDITNLVVRRMEAPGS
jgi:outer membrane protein